MNTLNLSIVNTPLLTYKLIISLIFLFIASISDFKYLKIPNKLTYSFLFLPIIFHLLGDPIKKSNIIGLVVGFFIVFIPAFITGTPMGGDIKSVSGLGFLLGPQAVIQVFFIAIMVGLPISIIHRLMLKKKEPLPFAVLLLVSFMLITLINTF